MAQQGMFGNYQQQLADETALRKQSAQTGGLTGWAAITNAMSGIGSEFGYSAGKAFGGMTPVEEEQARFQSVMDSVNYDPTNPDSMMEASAALNAAGFYDKGLEMFNLSNQVKADNLTVKIKQFEFKEAQKKANTPDARGMTELGDGYKYWTDSLEAGTPERVVGDIEKPPKDKSAAMLKYERNQAAVEYRNTVLKDRPSESLEDKRILLKEIDDAGYSDTPLFTQLQDTITEIANTERIVSKDVKTDAEQQAKIAADARLREMGNVMPTGEGNNIVGGVFLRDKPDAGSDIKALALQNEIGGILQSYDRRLSKREDSKVTPAEAYPYYTRVFNLPEVYQGKSGMTWGGVEFNADALQQTLDAIFGVSGAAIPNDRLIEFGQQRLLIDGVSNYLDVNGVSQVYKFKQ